MRGGDVSGTKCLNSIVFNCRLFYFHFSESYYNQSTVDKNGQHNNENACYAGLMFIYSKYMEKSSHSGIFFLVSSGAEIRPLSQWDLGDFFPIWKKKSQSKNIFFFFFKFSFSHHTQTSYMVTVNYHCILFSFNLMAIVCVIANLFLN